MERCEKVIELNHVEVRLNTVKIYVFFKEPPDFVTLFFAKLCFV